MDLEILNNCDTQAWDAGFLHGVSQRQSGKVTVATALWTFNDRDQLIAANLRAGYLEQQRSGHQDRGESVHRWFLIFCKSSRLISAVSRTTIMPRQVYIAEDPHRLLGAGRYPASVESHGLAPRETASDSADTTSRR